MKKRLSIALLCLCMAVTLMPTIAFAAGESAISPGAGGIPGYSSTAGYHYIYMGTYNGSPVKWRVLDDKTNTGAPGLFLLSDILLGTGASADVIFKNSEPYSNAWQNSDAQGWCGAFAASSLTEKELAAVLATTKNDAEFTSSYHKARFIAAENILADDKVFFLSAEEVENSAYGFTDHGARKASYGGGEMSWWLRSPSKDQEPLRAGIVTNGGSVNSEFINVPWAARPAFNLNPNSVLFTSAAAGGKSSGAVDPAALSSNLIPAGTKEWKLTLSDDSRNFVISDISKSGDTVSFNYTGATVGTDEYISAIIKDSDGNITCYGRIAQPSAANGAAAVDLSGAAVNTGDTLYVFSEQYNGGTNDDTRLTDYASELVEISLGAPVLPTITTTTLPGGAVDTAYSQTLAATGTTPIIWSMADGSDPLPGGLTLTGNIISGTPTTVGTFNFTVKATNATGSDTQALSIVISAAPPVNKAPVRKSGVDATAEAGVTVNTAYTLDLATIFEDANADTLTYKVSVNGAADTGANASYSYTPASTGTTTLVFKANDGMVDSTDTYTVTLTANAASSGGGDSNPTTPPNTSPAETPKTETTITGNTATATTTTTATVDNNGKATAAVTQEQVSDAISQALAQAQTQGDGTAATVEIKVDAPADATTVETSIPKEAMKLAADGKTAALTVSTPIASISFDVNALSTISGEAAEDVKITASKVEASSLSEETQQLVGDRPVFNFSVTSGDTTISQFGGNVSVAVPYTPKAGEDTNAIVIYYINAEGKPEIVRNCVYDPVTGTVSFSTNHFSQYAVGYNKVSFKDVPADVWYSKAVVFIAARGITTGTGNGNYSPDARLTRGEFLVMMLRAYGIAPDTDLTNNFADAGNTYYTGYLAAAKRLGISEGVGNNMFAPGKEITRQEMFTLLYNALKVIGQLPQGNSGKTLSSFSDAGQIASWAKDAIALLVQTEAIGGNNGKLSPTSTATRVEMAQVLYNLLSNIETK